MDGLPIDVVPGTAIDEIYKSLPQIGDLYICLVAALRSVPIIFNFSKSVYDSFLHFFIRLFASFVAK